MDWVINSIFKPAICIFKIRFPLFQILTMYVSTDSECLYVRYKYYTNYP